MDMAQAKPTKWRKVVIQAAAGAVVGASTVLISKALLDPLIESGAVRVPDSSAIVAAGVGLVYLLMAACVGVGVAGPRMGAQILNVEDEEELRMQRRMLTYAAAAMALIGIAVLILAFSGPAGTIAAPTALIASIGLFAASVPLTMLQWRHMDELLVKVSAEAGMVTYYLLLVFGGGWALLAHLGYASVPDPLDWLSMIFGFVLLASFIAAGRRGMLMPR